MGYAELHCHSYFSLLDGASSPEALVDRAAELGLSALALTDHDSLAGAMRFKQAAQTAGLHAVIGAEVSMEDGAHLTLLAESEAGYANLCRLITASRLDQGPGRERAGDGPANSRMPELNWTVPGALEWPGKVAPALGWARLAEHSAGLIALSGCRRGPLAEAMLLGDDHLAQQAAADLIDIFGRRHLYIELQHHHLPGDDPLNRRLMALARRCELPLVATGNVHYARPEGSRLRDCLIAIDRNETLTAARQAGCLPLNSNYGLTAPATMARRFRHCPAAIANSVAIAERCRVPLDFSERRLPAFATPDGQSEFAYLYQLCHNNFPQRYPNLTPDVLTQLAHELAIIEKAELAGYFLIVWDIVRFAKTAGIRCQGRGSAANSIVAYLLGITGIDPLAHNLLFERFLSTDKFTTPDIDIDFAADRREEVIQYVYRRYGHDHAAMVCNVVTYRARSALRDLGKALAFPEPVINRLVKSLDSNSPSGVADGLDEQAGPDAPGEHPLRQLAGLMREIDGCPRHLSIHSGGMLITAQPLNEVVPLEAATMPGRMVVQWDKDTVEDAGLIKIDLLGLRTLGLISEALGYIKEMDDGTAPDLDRLALDDPAIYAMLQRGDTIGAFQVESRAQQQMLPRLKPTCFEDVAVEVAIVRPGPIQGGAVHPYLRRRAGLEPVSYLHPSLEPVLAETLGVLLFQEQAIRVAVAAAGFAPGEADMLRRAMSRSRSDEAMAAMRVRFLDGALQQGIDNETAAAIFGQLAGFAGYGFCKSHAASFALIAYQTLYLKCYHPAAFYCALFNQQPMGFYSPEVIAGDARRHGVEILPPEINRSGWGYNIERDRRGRLALRMGLSTVGGLGDEGWERIEAARVDNPFIELRDLCVRTRLDRDVVSNLIRAGGLDEFGKRRELLWQLGDIDYRPDEFELLLPTIATELPALEALEQTAWEYELLGLSADGQIMAHYREALRKAGVLSTWQVKQERAGRRVQVAGLVVVRQQPGTAKGMLFMSLEDESGLLDLVVRPDVYERLREALRVHPLILATGLVQRGGQAVSLLVGQAWPLRDAQRE